MFADDAKTTLGEVGSTNQSPFGRHGHPLRLPNSSTISQQQAFICESALRKHEISPVDRPISGGIQNPKKALAEDADLTDASTRPVADQRNVALIDGDTLSSAPTDVRKALETITLRASFPRSADHRRVSVKRQSHAETTAVCSIRSRQLLR